MLEILLYASAFAALLLFALWLYELAYADAGVVDVGWTAGVGILAVAFAFVTDGWWARRLLVAALAGAWSLRLAAYIVRDRIAGKEEDGRYRELRAHWGANAHRNFLVFFEAQSPLIVLFALPMLVLMENPAVGFAGFEILGIAIWLIAVAGESVADYQLAAFRARPETRGRTCREGLWRYSRHPNYFFEWLHWWAYVAMGVGVERGWLTWLGPAVMLLFLFKLTGIPATENHALRSRADYADYQRTTSVFVPWFPRP